MSGATRVLVLSFLCLAVVLIAAFLRRKQVLRSRTTPSQDVIPSETYLGLRMQILQGLRGKVSLPPPARPTEPSAVLMDWNTENAIVSVVAVADGTASIYLSSGGGSIGGGQSHLEIRDAALHALSLASSLQTQMKPVSAYPLPEQGSVIFYVVSDAGVLSATGRADDLAEHRHPFSSLGDAMQQIITLYRVLQTGSSSGS